MRVLLLVASAGSTACRAAGKVKEVLSGVMFQPFEGAQGGDVARATGLGPVACQTQVNPPHVLGAPHVYMCCLILLLHKNLSAENTGNYHMVIYVVTT